MIKLRLSTFERDKDQDIHIVEGETLFNAVTRSIENVPMEFPIGEVFQTHINGYHIHPDLWVFTKLKTEDLVLINPILKGGDGNSALGQILIVAAVVIATYYTGGTAFAGGWGAVGATAIRVGAMVVATYLSSQLFPPPVMAGQGNYDAGDDSQMYSITSQANVVKKFGYVPRVYGTHRMFPILAANPYTTLEIDPATGKKAQYFYAIYDFGFGPNLIKDIKIGETSINDYSDITTRIVDPNKPAISEGDWDDAASDHFELYKGDVSTENVGVTINSNEYDGAPQAEYRVIRNATANIASVPQEITVTLVNPQGLFASNSGGAKMNRSIDLDIFYSKVGEDNWIPYNDVNLVERFEAIGGDTATADRSIELAPVTNLATLGSNFYQAINMQGPTIISMASGQPLYYETTYQIINSGGPFLKIKQGHGLLAGNYLKFNGQIFAQVTNFSNAGGGYDVVAISFIGTRFWMYLFTLTVREDLAGGVIEYIVQGSVNNRIIVQGAPPGRLVVTGNVQEPYFSSVRFTPKAIGDYKVRVTRLQGRSLPAVAVTDLLTFAELKTTFDTQPIKTNLRHTFLEIRIKATGQINGSIQNLSAICSSVLDVYNGSTWEKQITNNPAWVYADLLTGIANKRALDKSKLHLPSIVEWANYCNAVPVSGALYTFVEKRFQSNFVLDYTTTLQDVLLKITSSAQAGLNMIDGKYGVLLDIERTIPVQIFSPRNSTGFSSQKIFSSRPHGLKVTYIDPNSSWQPNELIVYDDGFTALNAEEFEEIQTFACTQVEQAWRFGRYFLAQNKLRQETITLKADFEHIVCTRGDYVQIVQDAMKVGGTAARVKSIVSNRILIDEGIDTGAGPYGYTFRSQAGVIYTNTLTVVSADTFDLNGSPLPQAGDLVIIGEMGFIAYDCIVKSITPQDDMSAILTLVEKADALYTIESVDTIPGYDPLISNSTNEFSPPSQVLNLAITANTYNILSSSYEYYMDIDWDEPTNAAYDIFEVYVDDGGGFELEASVKDSKYRYIVDPGRLGISHTFKVLAVSATGKKLGLGEVTGVSGTPLSKTSKPMNITEFNCDITGEVLQLFWTKVADLDIKEYVLRFTPDVSGLWETSTVLMRVSALTSLIATQARTGTYLIKPIDFNGNEALDSASIITTIPNLFNLNVIAETDDFPPITGQLERTVNQGDSAVILDLSAPGNVGEEQYYPDGYYYYDDFLDMGDIYSTRIQSNIVAEGLIATDLMVNWPTLAGVTLLYSPGSADWDVESQYRATNTLNTISDWVTLNVIASMSQGSNDIWTSWRKFNIGDVTARIVQFRLKLMSNVLNVTPRVFEAKVKSDMPDRLESYNNLVAPSMGLEIAYSPAFKGPGTTPNIQISIENGQSGDYFTYTYKTLEGFKIVFYDKNNNAVSRQFDAAVKGYGRKALNTI